MADKHGAHQTTKAYITSLTDDFCKSPTAPVGYMIWQTLDPTIQVCETVRWQGTPLLTMAARFTSVNGNEAGVGGGVCSGVNKGWCKPVLLASSTVFAEGRELLRDGTLVEMNSSSPDGVGNVQGKLKYVSTNNDRSSIPPIPDDMKMCHATPPELAPWMWVNIDANDLIHVGLAAVLSPIAVALKAVSSLFPGFDEMLKQYLPATSAGTGDKTGLGAITGNNDGNGPPGIAGLSVSLAKILLEPFSSEGGFIDGARFEKGQGEEGHDAKTGVGFESSAPNSFGETIGQLLGVLFRKIGLGDEFYSIVNFLFGDPDKYGFVTGVWKGTWQLPV